MIVLSRYSEVTAALREPNIVLDSSTRQLRDEAHALLSSTHLATWISDWDADWRGQFADLPEHFDFIVDFAEPLCRRLAAQVTGIDDSAALLLAPVALKLFDAAANREAAATAINTMMLVIQSPLKLQAFAALCHILPAFLGNACCALLTHPVEMARLVAKPEILPDAIEELLRFAGPSVAVFRQSANGQRIKLELAKANRDPDVFPAPARLQFNRRGAGHVALGAGPHACAGEALIRRATQTPILLFARRFSGRTTAFRPEPVETGTLRSMRSLLVHT